MLFLFVSYIMQKIYAFSGLGADKRVFSKLDFSGYEVIYIGWLLPEVGETLSDYALRLALYYQIPAKGAFVIGVSFGGMCIAELAKTYDFKKIVFVSTAKTKYELPKLYRLSTYFPIYKFIPEKVLNTHTILLNWLFTINTKAEKELLKEIMEDSDPTFLKWAMQAIVGWKNEKIPKDFLHLHGCCDRIIPINCVKDAIPTAKAGHFMIWSKAEQLSVYIRKYWKEGIS